MEIGAASLFRGPPCFAVSEAYIFPRKIRETGGLTVTRLEVGAFPTNCQNICIIPVPFY